MSKALRSCGHGLVGASSMQSHKCFYTISMLFLIRRLRTDLIICSLFDAKMHTHHLFECCNPGSCFPSCSLFFSSDKNLALSQVVTKLRPGAGVCMAFSHRPVDANEFFLFIPDPKMFAISVSRINRRGESRTNQFQVSHHRIPYMNLMVSSVHPNKIFPTRSALLCLPTRHISYSIMICSKTCEPERSCCA